MRHPWSHAWVRSVVAVTALLAAGGLASEAAAQQSFDRLVVFGDSYADLTLSDKPASNPLAPTIPPNGALLGLSVWRVYPLSLQAHLGIPTVLDVAVGGATASPLIGPPEVPPKLNLPQQVGAFLATNPPLGRNDLITLSIGGNDIRDIVRRTAASQGSAGYPNAPLTADNAKTFADVTTSYVMNGAIAPLVGAGGHNFVLAGFSAISGLPELQGVFNGRPDLAVAADKYADAYFSGMQAALRPFAIAGERFFLFDLGKLGQQVLADPRYGFTYTSFDANGKATGSLCPKIDGVPSSGTVCGGVITSREQDKYYFGPDGLHLTNAGFDLVGRYMANIVQAPSTIAIQPGVVSSTTRGFVGALQGRLDTTRVNAEVAGASASDGPMGLGKGERSSAPPAGPASPLTAYVMGTYLGGNDTATSSLPGYDYDARSGTVGIEYGINRNLILGLAGNTTTTNADLSNGAGVDVDAIQGAAYLSYATRQMFAEALAAYASHSVDLSRPGILDTVHSSTDAMAVALSARGGYLADFGTVRAGPIAGITYVRSRVDGYTETGDDLLTFKVGEQTLDSLTFNMGLRFLAPFRASGSVIVPYLNVLLEHQFGDQTHTLTASLTQASSLPILTPITDFDTRTYGRVEGGVTFELGPQLSATINAASTFARDDARDYYINAGLNYRF